MRYAVKFLCFGLAALGILSSSTSKAGVDAESAAQLYKKGEWQNAIQAFKDLTAIADNQNNSALYYNLAAAYYRDGQYGAAYTALHKAKILSPLDGDIQHNFRITRDHLSPGTLLLMPASWQNWLPWQLRFIPKGLWLMLALIGFLILLIRWDIKNPWPMERISWCTLSFAFLLLYILFASENRYSLAGTIIDTTVRSGPEFTFPEISKIPSGALFDLEEIRDGWAKVRLQIGGESSVGWLELSKTLLITQR